MGWNSSETPRHQGLGELPWLVIFHTFCHTSSFVLRVFCFLFFVFFFFSAKLYYFIIKRIIEVSFKKQKVRFYEVNMVKGFKRTPFNKDKNGSTV